jgi:formylglycine-generating enzyme required for sulfatase activity
MSSPSLRVVEPGGTRDVALPCSFGGSSQDALRIPDAAGTSAGAFGIEDGEFGIRTAAALPLRLNGRRLPADGFRRLAPGDMLAVGGTRVSVEAVGDRPALVVRHLLGNDTVPPLRASAPMDDDGGSADAMVAAVAVSDPTAAAGGQGRRGRSGRLRLWPGIALASAAAVAVLLWAVLRPLQPVTVVTFPADATVRGSGISWRSGPSLFLMPGPQLVTVRAPGHREATRRLQVRAGEPQRLEVRLEPLPGTLDLDTGGVAAKVFVDGAEVGSAPGAIEVAAGERTLLLRAPRHLDAVQRVTVEGRGVRQAIGVPMRPSWGRLEASAVAAAATLSVDGAAATPLPAALDLPAGLRRLEVNAPGARAWRSAVLIEPGKTLRIGPIELGAPDAVVSVRSQPAGAEVTAGGVFRGRTPVDVTLAPGVDHDLGLALQGYASATRRVPARAGERSTLVVALQPVLVAFTVQGEPTDAEVWVGGQARGRAPLTLQLPARPHRIELRHPGSQPQSLDIDLSSAVARTVDYSLLPEGRPAGWKPAPATLVTPTGRTLRLLPAGSHTMGSERREQGRRANEFTRRVTLARPVYIAVREVTNGEFRRFRPSHAAGFVQRRTVDLDAQSASGVSWADAVEYCNWLSAQEGLPPAYEKSGDGWALRQPVTTGYRLPTEAEWEYAARQVPLAGRARRYEWGDELPPPAGSANLAGSEAEGVVQPLLEGWQDEHPSVAPPGKYPANGLGLHDMTGNVSEWVHDAYASFDPAAGGTDPTGPATGTRRVVKGANWRTAAFSELRPAWREGAAPSSASQDIGFRIARYAE